MHRLFRKLLVLLLLSSCLPLLANDSISQSGYPQAILQFERLLQDTRRQGEQLAASEAELHEQLTALQGSPLLYRVLQEQRQALPRIHNDQHLPDVIAGIRLRQFEVNQQLRQLKAQQQQNPQLELEQEHLQTLLALVVQLQNERRDLLYASQRLSRVLNERLFWVQSNPPINAAWLLSLPSKISKQLQQLSSGSLLKLRQDQLFSSLWRTLVLLFAAFSVWLLRHRIRLYLQQINTQKECFQPASQNAVEPQAQPPSPWLTLQALALAALQLLPLPLLLLAFASLLSQPDSLSINLGAGFAALAFSGFMVMFMHQQFGQF